MEPTTVDRRRISMSLLRLAVVVLVFALVGLRLSASEGGFTATLAPEEQLAAGLAKLSSAEQTALNALVAREVSAARSGFGPKSANASRVSGSVPCSPRHALDFSLLKQ